MNSVSSKPEVAAYREHVNPQWVRMLDTLEMNVQYERCAGAELFTSDGRRILDFLSGYCVYNMGHNHPDVIAAVKAELDRMGPTMLQSHVPELAGELARRLTGLAGGRLSHVSFCSSGSEGVDTVIKFSRNFTRRPGVLYAKDGFHGLTCSSLSLMSDPFWREGFGPMLPETEAVEFNDLAALEKKLATKKFAVYITEPVQAEAGIRLPEGDYLKEAQKLCRKYGTLFALDEVQTGMYRTGKFLAAHHYGVEPDFAVIAKALSGGLVPSAAVMMSKPVCEAVYSSLERSMIHASTFGENGLAMRAGLAALDVLERGGLGARGEALGMKLRAKIEGALSKYEMFKTVRGLGMLSGIEFRAPERLKLRLAYEAFRRIHEGVFGQLLVMSLFKQKNILTQICGNQFMVLKVAPPLVISEEQIDTFVPAITGVVEAIHSSDAFWSEGIALVTRALKR